MRKSSFAVRTALFLVVAGAVGLFLGWLASRGSDKVPPSMIAPVTNESVAVAQPPPAHLQPGPAVRPQAADPAEAPDMSSPENPDDTSTNWENKLEHILLADDDENSKADHILALIPTVPPDAQVELSQHLVNLVQDDHYEDAASLLTNNATPTEVSTVLMNDLLNRANTLKLPMLLEVARDDGHPLKDQAREMLELLLQEDHGTNWDDWNSSITTWLANNQ